MAQKIRTTKVKPLVGFLWTKMHIKLDYSTTLKLSIHCKFKFAPGTQVHVAESCGSTSPYKSARSHEDEKDPHCNWHNCVDTGRYSLTQAFETSERCKFTPEEQAPWMENGVKFRDDISGKTGNIRQVMAPNLIKKRINSIPTDREWWNCFIVWGKPKELMGTKHIKSVWPDKGWICKLSTTLALPFQCLAVNYISLPRCQTYITVLVIADKSFR